MLNLNYYVSNYGLLKTVEHEIKDLCLPYYINKFEKEILEFKFFYIEIPFNKAGEKVLSDRDVKKIEKAIKFEFNKKDSFGCRRIYFECDDIEYWDITEDRWYSLLTELKRAW